MAAIDRRFAMQATKTTIVALVVGIALVAGAAQAQSTSPTNGASSLEQLRTALHLSAQQEGAWQLYRSAADIPDKAQMRRRAASGLFRTLDAPHRMDLVEAEMRAELADLQRQSQALKAFYGALSPEQQRIFDARTLPPPGDAQQTQSPY